MTTRYVQQGTLWVPEYTLGSGVGDWVARGLARLGVTQKAGCGCPKKQAWLNRLGGAAPTRTPWVPYGKGARRRGQMPPIRGGSPTMYYNSSETGCDGSDATVVFCDDFETADTTPNASHWFGKGADTANASGGLLQTKGWAGYEPGSWGSPSLATYYLNNWTCSDGAGGSACSARSYLLPGPNADNLGNVAEHAFGPNGDSYSELYTRIYIKYSTDHTLNSQKTFVWNVGGTAPGTFGITVGGFGNGAGWLAMCPVADCNGELQQNPLNTGCPGGNNFYLCPNLGVNPDFTSMRGHWLYVEMRIRMNSGTSTRDGMWELWLNDCGTDGVCTGSPTKRASFNNVIWTQPANTLGTFYIDQQSPAGDPTTGEEWYDQIRIGTAFNGFMGAVTPAASVGTRVLLVKHH